MLKLSDAREAGRGIFQKTVGLGMEAVGTLFGNDRLKDIGRDRQDAGDERIQAIERETKAEAKKAEAQTKEARQQANQDPEDRSYRGTGDTSAGGAAAEKAKGAVKQVAGRATGNGDLEEEGEAQSEKAGAEAEARKEEAKAKSHRAKAEGHEEVAERK